MAHYVCGFLFTQARDAVVMIEKNRPSYMKGRLNGIGGSVEKGEKAHEAMVREFAEETGYTVNLWQVFLSMMTMRGDRIDFFAAESSYDPPPVMSVTDEEVSIISLTDLKRFCTLDKTMANVMWEVEMAISVLSGRETTKCFHVIETEECQVKP